MKGSIDPATMQPSGLVAYANLCGWSLARAHARTGDAVAISAYLGSGDRFDGAIADFGEAYAEVNRRDHAAYKAAIADGTVSSPRPDRGRGGAHVYARRHDRPTGHPATPTRRRRHGRGALAVLGRPARVPARVRPGPGAAARLGTRGPRIPVHARVGRAAAGGSARPRGRRQRGLRRSVGPGDRRVDRWRRLDPAAAVPRRRHDRGEPEDPDGLLRHHDAAGRGPRGSGS